nr:MAG TPA: hypothetical protein [Caudoviricetes sp.]DAX59307.1 MAG TPA: hypothetical protein [Caudoviricetes sp.]
MFYITYIFFYITSWLNNNTNHIRCQMIFLISYMF